MKVRKSWREKLADSKDLPRVQTIPDRLKARWGEGTFVIPAPNEVDELMRRVPKGKVTTINHLRAAIAKKHGATVGCPMTTGIFAWIAANAAEEIAAAKPNARVTPYWRTLKTGGLLNEKYPGGVLRQKQRLKAEGQTVVKKGKHLAVSDLDKSLFDFGVGR
jgi:alkylated DNA nucleotide flippase Atl1